MKRTCFFIRKFRTSNLQTFISNPLWKSFYKIFIFYLLFYKTPCIYFVIKSLNSLHPWEKLPFLHIKTNVFNQFIHVYYLNTNLKNTLKIRFCLNVYLLSRRFCYFYIFIPLLLNYDAYYETV